jgi:hypothetical protein
MTDPELIDVLAGTLEVLAGKFRARLDSPSGFDPPALRGILKHAEAVCVEAVALADEPREDPTEEDLRALKAVAEDRETARGLGTAPTITAVTWELVAARLRWHGVAAED